MIFLPTIARVVRGAIPALALILAGGTPAGARDVAPVAPEGCDILFVGSSTIHRWSDLARDMRPWTARNRGVDGASIRETTIRFRNAPDGPPPRAIVFYGGDNDLAGGETAAGAIEDLRAFLVAGRQRAGDVPVLIVSVKPSPSRLALLPEQAAYNRGARAVAAAPNTRFVDIVPRMMAGGRPGPFYVADGLHMNAAGYALWRDAIGRALRAALPRTAYRACARAGR